MIQTRCFFGDIEAQISGSWDKCRNKIKETRTGQLECSALSHGRNKLLNVIIIVTKKIPLYFLFQSLGKLLFEL